MLHIQCALVGTPLSLLQRHKLSSMVPNSAFLVHIDSCRPTRGQIKPPGKRRVFLFIFSQSVFTRKIKLQKQSAKLANIDVCGPTYVKNCTSEKKKSAIFLQCTVYLLYGKPYWLIFQKKTINVPWAFFVPIRKLKIFLSYSEFHTPLQKQIITLQKFHVPISIDISFKTHQFVCIRQA